MRSSPAQQHNAQRMAACTAAAPCTRTCSAGGLAAALGAARRLDVASQVGLLWEEKRPQKRGQTMAGRSSAPWHHSSPGLLQGAMHPASCIQRTCARSSSSSSRSAPGALPRSSSQMESERAASGSSPACLKGGRSGWGGRHVCKKREAGPAALQQSPAAPHSSPPPLHAPAAPRRRCRTPCARARGGARRNRPPGAPGPLA